MMVSRLRFDPRSLRGKASKYHNCKCEVDGLKFDSKAEAARYSVLLILEKTGHIRDLVRQKSYPLVVNGVRVAAYIADFAYFDVRSNLNVVEDVKSPASRTPVYRLKKKLLKACYGIEITEIM